MNVGGGGLGFVVIVVRAGGGAGAAGRGSAASVVAASRSFPFLPFCHRIGILPRLDRRSPRSPTVGSGLRSSARHPMYPPTSGSLGPSCALDAAEPPRSNVTTTPPPSSPPTRPHRVARSHGRPPPRPVRHGPAASPPPESSFSTVGPTGAARKPAPARSTTQGPPRRGPAPVPRLHPPPIITSHRPRFRPGPKPRATKRSHQAGDDNTRRLTSAVPCVRHRTS